MTGPVPPRWFDTHCHLQDEADPGAVLEAAQRAGVTSMVCVGTDVASSRVALALAGDPALAPPRGVQLWATVGLHPHYADRSGAEGAERTGIEGVEGVEALVDAAGPAPGRTGPVVAVGECGLDYHYDNSPRPAQRSAFGAQVALARARHLTLVVHTREAWDDTFAILASEGVPDRVILHCFTGGPAEARKALDLGAWLSFSGIATFKGAGDVRAAAALCPAQRLLVETDSPYLAPVPRRGQPNQPAFVGLVGAAVAAARGVTAEELASSSWAAAREAFALA